MTTPRDAIGLSERLRDRFTVGAYVQPTHLHCPDYSKGRALLEEAATALDAFQARVVELEAENHQLLLDAITNTPLYSRRKLEEKLKAAESRATSAEQERDKLQGMLLLCGELGGIGKDETPVAYLRRLIDGLIDAGRERDEALERLKPFAKAGELFQTREPGDYDQCVYAPAAGSEYNLTADHLRAARDLVRRLAAGTGDF